MTVVIAAGGTGGHIFPGIAVAEQLQRRGFEVIFMGSRKGLERTLVPREGYDLVSLPIHGFLGKPLPERARFPVLATVSFLICLWVLARKRAAVVVGCGGYVAFPVLLAASFLGIPTVISEQDSRPGLSTRVLARFVDEVHLPDLQAASYFRGRTKVSVSGNPLRLIISPVDKAEAREKLGLDQRVRTVLVFGGSQGASSINRAFQACLSGLPEVPELQFIWITGRRDHAWAAKLEGKAAVKLKVMEFTHHMGYAYSASDLVVSRAGGLATAEITAFGLPSILIPFPFAAGAHQEVKARILEQSGAAKVILDEDLDGETLAREILSLVSDEKALCTMAKRAKQVGRRNGAEKVADAVVRLAGGRGTG